LLSDESTKIISAGSTDCPERLSKVFAKAAARFRVATTAETKPYLPINATLQHSAGDGGLKQFRPLGSQRAE